MTTKNKSIAEVIPQFRKSNSISALDLRIEVFASDGKWWVKLPVNRTRDEIGPDSMPEHMAYQIALTMTSKSIPTLLRKIRAQYGEDR